MILVANRLPEGDGDSIIKHMVEYVGRELGDYRIVEQIGAGGMGKVFLAENVHHRKKYALKILPRELSRDANFRKRFFDEARVMSELEHSNIVRVHHMGEDQGVYYLVMDYVVAPDGRPRSIHEELVRSSGRRISPRRTHRLILQIAHGLAYAHKRGVVHRDIKPANILIDQNSDARITDFGLVKAVGKEFLLSQIHETIQQSLQHGVQPTMTLIEPDQRRVSKPLDVSRSVTVTKSPSGSSGLFGTYDYMSPELIEGQDATEQSDIYSLGVTIYRMLTGRRAVGMAKPPSELVPGLRKRWDVITRRCLAENLKDRYRNLTELISDLHKVNGPRQIRALVLVGFCMILLLGTVSYIVNPEPYRVLWRKVEGVMGRNDRSVLGSGQELPEPSRPGSDPTREPPRPSVDQNLAPLETARRALQRTQALFTVVQKEPWLGDLDGLARSDIEDANQLVIAERYDDAIERYDGLARDLARSVLKQTEEVVTVVQAVPVLADIVDVARQKIIDVNSVRSNAEYQIVVNACIDTIGGLVVSEGSYVREAIRGLESFPDTDVFSARIETVKGDMDRADGQVEAKLYGDAIKAYTTGLERIEALRETLEKYGAASAAQTEADWARSHAIKVQADQCVCQHGGLECTCFQALYRQALKLLTDAEDGFANGKDGPYESAREQFDLAAMKFSEAGKSFQEAATQIQALAEELCNAWSQIQNARMPRRLREEFGDRANALAASAWAAFDEGQLHQAVVDYRQAIRLKNFQETASIALADDAALTLVFVPKGEFHMGSRRDEKGRQPNEQYPLLVTVGEGFYISKYEITQAQYEAVMDVNPSTFSGPDLPVERVSWRDANLFCEKLTALGHGHFRLPSEVEWEYACRAHSEFAYSQGNSIDTGLKKVGWYNQLATNRTKPVGQRDENRFGLHDMHGNVWEWCDTPYVESVPATSVDPNTAGVVVERVIRGGSWKADALSCRSATRVGASPETRRDDIGFRVLMDVE